MPVADEAAHRAYACLEYLEVAAVPHAPDGALPVGGH